MVVCVYIYIYIERERERERERELWVFIKYVPIEQNAIGSIDKCIVEKNITFPWMRQKLDLSFLGEKYM